MDNPAIPPPRMIMCSHFAPVMVVAAFFTFVRVGDTSVLRGLNLRIWIAFDADGCIGMGCISMAASLDAIVLLEGSCSCLQWAGGGALLW